MIFDENETLKIMFVKCQSYSLIFLILIVLQNIICNAK